MIEAIASALLRRTGEEFDQLSLAPGPSLVSRPPFFAVLGLPRFARSQARQRVAVGGFSRGVEPARIGERVEVEDAPAHGGSGARTPQRCRPFCRTDPRDLARPRLAVETRSASSSRTWARTAIPPVLRGTERTSPQTRRRDGPPSGPRKPQDDCRQLGELLPREGVSSLFLRLLEPGCQVAPATGDCIRGGHP